MPSLQLLELGIYQAASSSIRLALRSPLTTPPVELLGQCCKETDFQGGDAAQLGFFLALVWRISLPKPPLRLTCFDEAAYARATQVYPQSAHLANVSEVIEGHASHGTNPGMKAVSVVASVSRILAIDLICASNALRSDQVGMAAHPRRVCASVRGLSPRLGRGRTFAEDIERLSPAITAGKPPWCLFETEAFSPILDVPRVYLQWKSDSGSGST